MKKLIPFLLIVTALGCGSDELSQADQAKLKASMSKGGDANAMTPEQRKEMEEYMRKNMGGSAPSAPK